MQLRLQDGPRVRTNKAVKSHTHGIAPPQGLLTAPLAGAYFLGFLGGAGACRKSPMISSRKVDIIPNYQTQHTRVRRPAVLLAALRFNAGHLRQGLGLGLPLGRTGGLVGKG